MKKLAFAAMVLALTGSMAFGLLGLSAGPKGGIVMSKFSGLPSGVTADMRTGFAIGGFVNFGLLPVFSLQPELLYTMKGAKQKASGTIGGVAYSSETTYKMDYIDIPILAKASFGVGIKPYIFAGPVFSMKAGANYDAKSTVGTTTTTSSGSLTNVKGMDMGLTFGAGVDMPFKLSLDARYNLGLSKISDIANDNTKNATIYVLVGYAFM